MKTASVVSVAGDNAYGVPVDADFTRTFQSLGGHVVQHLQISQNEQNLDEIVSTLAKDPNPGIIFLAMTSLQDARDLIMKLHHQNVKAPVLCSDAIDSDLFPASFASYEKKEKEQPGYFTN